MPISFVIALASPSRCDLQHKHAELHLRITAFAGRPIEVKQPVSSGWVEARCGIGILARNSVSKRDSRKSRGDTEDRGHCSDVAENLFYAKPVPALFRIEHGMVGARPRLW
jgi:hypothetical protein